MNTALRPQKIQTSLQTLLDNCTKNYTNSCCFMKQLTTIAISTITYIRNIYSEDNYNTEYFHELTVNILKSRCKDKYAQYLSDMIHGTFEAIDKKYLETLSLIFHVGSDPIPDNIIESFRFEYAYSKAGCPFTMITSNKSGSEDIKKIDVDTVQMSTISLLRCCQRTVTAPMPDDLNLSIKLFYKSDAPKGYQAPGFKPGPSTFDRFEQEVSNEDYTHMQQIKTPFHTLNMKCWVNNTVNVSCDAEPSSPASNLSNDSPQEPISIKCNCGATLSDIEFGRKLEMIECIYCKDWQHSICYGYLDAASVTTHCCYLCARDDPDRIPTDQKLQCTGTKDKLARKNLCITRRILEWCTHINYVSCKSIMHNWGAIEKDAIKFIDQLKKIGVVKQCDETESLTKQTEHKVVRENLIESLKIFFYDYKKSNYSLTLSANTVTESPIITYEKYTLKTSSPETSYNFKTPTTKTSSNFKTPSPEASYSFKTPSPKTSNNLNNSPAIFDEDIIDPFDDFVSPQPPLRHKAVHTTHGTLKMMQQLSSAHITPQKRYIRDYKNIPIFKRKRL